MARDNIRNLRCEFLINEALAASVIAALSRSGTYRRNAPDTERQRFRDDLKQRLLDLKDAYRQEAPSEAEHIRHICTLSKELSAAHVGILRENHKGRRRFRIGIAQKAINLFLKYLWCMGEIQEPPHCPFDGIVLDKLARFSGKTKLVPWTKMDDSAEYRRYVKAARKALAEAPESSLATWELRIFEQR